jgi:hypothetical protein
MLGTIVSRFRGLWKRRYYLWSRIMRPQVPVHSLSWLPDGFCLSPVPGTDICIADGFASSIEPLPATAENRISQALNYRAAMLSGMPDGYLRHVDRLNLTPQANTIEITSQGSDSVAVCVFTASVSAELTIVAEGKRVAIQLLPGRAVRWNLVEGYQPAQLQLASGQGSAEALVFLYSSQRCAPAQPVDDPRQARTGVPLNGDEVLPTGVWAPGADHLEAVFGKPDFLTDLINK